MFRKKDRSSIQPEFFDERSFFKAFSIDIKNAKHEVIIESPYITRRRATEFSNLCSKQIKSGLRIKVLTRNPNHHDGSLRDQAFIGITILEQADITVHVFDDLRHRKLAIVDNSILWEGSLNMLSHSNSKEIMRRDVSPVLCTQVLRLL